MPDIGIPVDVDEDEASLSFTPPTLPAVPQLPQRSPEQALQRAKLNLEAANTEVDRLQPTIEKLLTAAGLNLREGAVGFTKQAVGNIARSYADIVAPETPHKPGSLKSFLQWAFTPVS